MWIRIRAVVVEDEPLAAQYLASLLDETCQVEVVGTAADAATALSLCAECRPDAAFLDVNLPGTDGLSLAVQLTMLPQPPRLVFTTGHADRAADAFRLDAVDYLLKPIDPDQVGEAVNRLLACLRPFEAGRPDGTPGNPLPGMEAPASVEAVAPAAETAAAAVSADPGRLTGELLPVRDADRDQIRLLSRREIVAVLRRDRRTWVHTVREEFATYHPLTELLRWLGGPPFIQVGRHAVANLRAVEQVIHYGDRLYRLRLRDRQGTEVTVSRSGAVRLAAVLKGLSKDPVS